VALTYLSLILNFVPEIILRLNFQYVNTLKLKYVPRFEFQMLLINYNTFAWGANLWANLEFLQKNDGALNPSHIFSICVDIKY
jgi:hypothetical protein